VLDNPPVRHDLNGMDRIACMKAFIRVAETGSLSEAARQLGMSKSAVSKQVDALEALVGRPLLHRSPRAMRLTEAGSAAQERCRRILAEMDGLADGLGAGPGPLTGMLRMSSPTSFGSLVLAPALADFIADHPELTVELIHHDRPVDPVQEGFDIAFLGQHTPRDSLVARRLCPLRRVYCAAPAYLDRRGMPKLPDDLTGHDCIHYSHLASGTAWPFHHVDGGQRSVRIRPRLATDSGAVMLQAALAGSGVALLPTLLAGDALRDGRLIRILPGWRAPDVDIAAAYPVSHRGNPKIRRLLDFLTDRLGPVPPWDAGLDPHLSGMAAPSIVSPA